MRVVDEVLHLLVAVHDPDEDADPNLTAGQVDIAVYGGHVILVGIVNSYEQVQDFIDDAQGVPGVLSVRSYIQVAS